MSVEQVLATLRDMLRSIRVASWGAFFAEKPEMLWRPVRRRISRRRLTRVGRQRRQRKLAFGRAVHGLTDTPGDLVAKDGGAGA